MINAIGIPLLEDNDFINERNDALLKDSCLYRVPAYIYSITTINDYTQCGKIRALFWDGGTYRACHIDLPKYTEIYCSIHSLRLKYPEEMTLLNRLTVLTDDIGLLKYDFQRKLLFSELSQYAIPTLLVRSYDELISRGASFRRAFLKPFGGSKAMGAMQIEERAGKLCYTTPEDAGELTYEVFREYLCAAGFDESTPLLLQPCLNTLDDNGHAVDFHCLVSLNGEGKWQNVLTYARIGDSGVASNISHGGSLNFAERVLESFVPGHGKGKLEEINRVALQAAELVQKESLNPVSWLGLDICVDRPSNQVYIIEANSKPGTKLIGPWPLSLVRAQFFRYLLNKSDSDAEI